MQDQVVNDLTNKLVSALVQLHLEAQHAQYDRQELVKYATAVGQLCDQVDSQFGTRYVMHLIARTTEKLAQLPKPPHMLIGGKYLKLMVAQGFKVRNVQGTVRYK